MASSPCSTRTTAIKFILGVVLIVTLILVQPPKCQVQGEPSRPPGYEKVSHWCGQPDKSPITHYQELVRSVKKELIQHTHQYSFTYYYQEEDTCFGYAHCDPKLFSADECIDCLHVADVDVTRDCGFSISADEILRGCRLKFADKDFKWNPMVGAVERTFPSAGKMCSGGGSIYHENKHRLRKVSSHPDLLSPGRKLELYSNQPRVKFYTCNMLKNEVGFWRSCRLGRYSST